MFKKQKTKLKKFREKPEVRKFEAGIKTNFAEVKLGVKGKRKLTNRPDIYAKAHGFKKRLDIGLGDFRTSFEVKGGKK